MKPAAGYRGPLAYSSPEAVQTTGTVAVVRFGAAAANEGVAYFARLEALGQRLNEILGRPVEVAAEPVRRPQVRRNIETDSVLVF